MIFSYFKEKSKLQNNNVFLDSVSCLKHVKVHLMLNLILRVCVYVLRLFLPAFQGIAHWSSCQPEYTLERLMPAGWWKARWSFWWALALWQPAWERRTSSRSSPCSTPMELLTESESQMFKETLTSSSYFQYFTWSYIYCMKCCRDKFFSWSFCNPFFIFCFPPVIVALWVERIWIANGRAPTLSSTPPSTILRACCSILHTYKGHRW